MGLIKGRLCGSRTLLDRAGRPSLPGSVVGLLKGLLSVPLDGCLALNHWLVFIRLDVLINRLLGQTARSWSLGDPGDCDGLSIC
jgi:hypothetical protein